jgi:hypothetical protein
MLLPGVNAVREFVVVFFLNNKWIAKENIAMKIV